MKVDTVTDKDDILMNEKFIAERITQLKIEKNISEYQLGYDLGLSKSYVGMISRNKNLPSMKVFLDICDYFDITPAQFFAPDIDENTKEIAHMLLELTEEDREIIKIIISTLIEKRKNSLPIDIVQCKN